MRRSAIFWFMGPSDNFHHSPLHAGNAQAHRSLLLQFLLFEMLLAASEEKKEAMFGGSERILPYDWAVQAGRITKIQMHVSLLSFAFPELSAESQAIERSTKKMGKPLKNIKDHLNILWVQLGPFLATCKDCDKLSAFLTKHSRRISGLSE
jgi:hypothetical protein